MLNEVSSVPISVAKTLSLGETVPKLTKDCFGECGIRNPNFDAWFPENQPGAGSCEVALLAIDKVFQMGELIEILFGLEPDISVDGLAKHLQKKGHLLTLPQIELVLRSVETLPFTLCDYHSFTVGTGDHLYLSIVHKHGHVWNAFPREIKSRSTLSPGAYIIIPNFEYGKFMQV